MKKLFFLVLFFILASCDDNTDEKENQKVLKNTTEISISKTWFQEPNGWEYPIYINVPNQDDIEGGLPVCILLHGNGGNGNDMLLEWKSFLPNHVLIAPSGYKKSWNIANEQSEAPDVEMLGDLIDEIQSYKNINPDKIRVIGHSNGAALSNRLFIENKNSGVDIICAIASQLSDIQFHNNNFYYPSGETGGNNNDFAGYNTVTTPITGRKYLGITNSNDPIIPYYGGWAMGIYYINSLEASHIIANSQGYNSSILTEENGVELGSTSVYEYSYLSGQVTHLRGFAEHYINETQRQYILDYFK